MPVLRTEDSNIPSWPLVTYFSRGIFVKVIMISRSNRLVAAGEKDGVKDIGIKRRGEDEGGRSQRVEAGSPKVP